MHSVSGQSSTGTIFRALVMLGCLVVIPLIAIFGKSLPEMFKTKFWGSQRPASTLASNPAGGPSQFQPMAPSGPIAASPVPNMPAPPRSGRTSWAAVPTTPRPITPVGYNSPLVPKPNPYAANPLSATQIPGVETAPPQSSAAAPTTDRFLLVQRRLRGLGATHCLLESWGNAGQLYRFRCEMAVGESPGCVRCFQATARDPSQAMAEVVQQVETWQARFANSGPRSAP